MRPVQYALFGLVVVVAALLAACDGLGGEPEIVGSQPLGVQPQPTPQELAASQATTGPAIFAENCAPCHGAQGRGDGPVADSGSLPPMPDFTDPSTMSVRTFDEIFTVITEGRMTNMMPPWRDALNEAQRRTVTEYVIQLGTGEVVAEADTAPTAISEALLTVTGSISSGTPGGQIPAGLEVTLYSIDAGFEETTFTTTTNADGTFTFLDIPVRADRLYAATVFYQDNQFASEVIPGDPTAFALDLPITLYEFTDDPNAVQIDNFVSQIGVVSETLYVVQIATFGNTTDRAYRAPHIMLPEGAMVEEPLRARYQLSDDGRQINDTLAVIPGRPHTMQIAYRLPYTSGLTLRQPVAYRLTNGYEIMIGTGGLEVSGDGLASFGDSAHGSRFGTQAAQAANSAIAFTISGVPEDPHASMTTTTPASGTSIPAAAYALIGVGTVAIAAAGFMFVQERRSTPPVTAGETVNVRAQIDDLMKQIAALDLEHQDGRISDKVYEKRRGTLKSRLMSLMAAEQAQS